MFYRLHRAQMAGVQPNLRAIAAETGYSVGTVYAVTGPYHLPKPPRKQKPRVG